MILTVFDFTIMNFAGPKLVIIFGFFLGAFFLKLFDQLFKVIVSTQ